MNLLAQTSNWGPAAIGLTVFVLLILLILFAVLFQFIGLYVRAQGGGSYAKNDFSTGAANYLSVPLCYVY